jgi:hypothetical protein
MSLLTSIEGLTVTRISGHSPQPQHLAGTSDLPIYKTSLFFHTDNGVDKETVALDGGERAMVDAKSEERQIDSNYILRGGFLHALLW